MPVTLQAAVCKSVAGRNCVHGFGEYLGTLCCLKIICLALLKASFCGKSLVFVFIVLTCKKSIGTLDIICSG